MSQQLAAPTCTASWTYHIVAVKISRLTISYTVPTVRVLIVVAMAANCVKKKEFRCFFRTPSIISTVSASTLHHNLYSLCINTVIDRIYHCVRMLQSD
jgi:hypothetical protein